MVRTEYHVDGGRIVVEDRHFCRLKDKLTQLVQHHNTPLYYRVSNNYDMDIRLTRCINTWNYGSYCFTKLQGLMFSVKPGEGIVWNFLT